MLIHMPQLLYECFISVLRSTVIPSARHMLCQRRANLKRHLMHTHSKPASSQWAKNGQSGMWPCLLGSLRVVECSLRAAVL